MRATPVWSILVAATAAAAILAGDRIHAQWSIGAPGARVAPAGKQRYSFLVYANPIAGREAEFNDWYTTVHMGDLIQLPGWVGAQRFRLVSNVTPRPTAAGYRHGYLIIWEIEETEAAVATARMMAAIAGGKIRRGAAFDYTQGAAGAGMYEVMGARVTRPDGKGPSMPDPQDPKAARLNRYILMDFANPRAGADAAFETAADQRVRQVLALPGFLAAQRFRQAPTTGPGAQSAKPRFLTVWEIEADTTQAASDALAQAIKGGTVTPLPSDDSTAELVYWEPITPHVTRDAFTR